jgi:hypothetical protein
LIDISSSELQCLDPDHHWFCNANDAALQRRHARQQPDRQIPAIETSIEYRQDAVAKGLQMFAYDDEGAGPRQEFMAEGIDRQLARCKACVVEYYKVKRKMIELLRT